MLDIINRITEGENRREIIFTEDRSERKRGPPSNKGAYAVGFCLASNKSWLVAVWGPLGKLKIAFEPSVTWTVTPPLRWKFYVNKNARQTKRRGWCRFGFETGMFWLETTFNEWPELAHQMLTMKHLAPPTAGFRLGSSGTPSPVGKHCRSN